MEIIRKVISISHDGFGEMWYPFSMELGNDLSLFNTDNYSESSDLLNLIRLMFATNNHQPNHSSIHSKSPRTQCEIRFSSDSNEYLLHRCLIGNYSSEITLHKVGTSIAFSGTAAIRILNSISRPINIVEGGMFDNKSQVFKSHDTNTMNKLGNLASTWAHIIGFSNKRISVDYNGRWSTEDDNHNQGWHRSGTRVSSSIRMIASLAQAVLRQRTIGNCPPIFASFNVNSLNEFECITFIDFMKSVCVDEHLQLIIGINDSARNTLIETIDSPQLSIYGY